MCVTIDASACLVIYFKQNVVLKTTYILSVQGKLIFISFIKSRGYNKVIDRR